MQSIAVDGTWRNRPDCDAAGRASDRTEELLAPGGVDLLRVVEQREWADGVVAQAFVVEEDARRDERAGEAPAAGLVRAGDEANAEAAIEGEKLAARTASGRHGPENSAQVRCFSRTRAFLPTFERK